MVMFDYVTYTVVNMPFSLMRSKALAKRAAKSSCRMSCGLWRV